MSGFTVCKGQPLRRTCSVTVNWAPSPNSNMAANVKHLLIVPGHYQCGPMQRQRQSSCGRSTGRHKMQEQRKLKSSKRIDTTGLINGRATKSAASLWHVPFRYHFAPILESHLHFLVLAAGWRRWWCSFVHHGCKVIYWLRATLTAWDGNGDWSNAFKFTRQSVENGPSNSKSFCHDSKWHNIHLNIFHVCVWMYMKLHVLQCVLQCVYLSLPSTFLKCSS